MSLHTLRFGPDTMTCFCHTGLVPDYAEMLPFNQGRVDPVLGMRDNGATAMKRKGMLARLHMHQVIVRMIDVRDVQMPRNGAAHGSLRAVLQMYQSTASSQVRGAGLSHQQTSSRHCQTSDRHACRDPACLPAPPLTPRTQATRAIARITAVARWRMPNIMCPASKTVCADRRTRRRPRVPPRSPTHRQVLR